MNEERVRPLVSSTYVVVFLMAAVALADIVARLFPLRLSEPAWRIGALGIVSLSVPTLLLALLIACVAAWYLEHRALLMSLAGVGLVAGLALLGVLPFLAMDLIQVRAMVPAESTRGFDLGMGRAAITLTVAGSAAVWIAYAGWNAAGKRSAGQRLKASDKAGVLIGQPR